MRAVTIERAVTYQDVWMTEQGDERLDSLLRAANPVDPDQVTLWGLDPALDGVFDALVKEVVADRPPPPRRQSRRLRRSLVVGAVAGTVLAGGGVAAATWTASHTGHHGSPGMTENDTSEWLDTAGDDFPAVARQLGQAFPFPPGDSVDAYIPGQLPHTGLMQVSAVQRTLAMDAACAWEGYWLQEHAAGHAADAYRAARTLEQVPTWTAITTTGGSSVVALYRAAAQAADDGDAAVVHQLWSVGCTDLPRKWAGK